jgi:hypothetical protein
VCLRGRLLALPLLLASACAHGRVARPPVLPVDVQTFGAVELYGPGLVATDDSGETVTFANVAPASVVIVRVWPGARVQPIYPVRGKDTLTFRAGMHTVPVARPERWMAWPHYVGEPFTAMDQEIDVEFAQRCLWNELRREASPPSPRPKSASPAPASSPAIGDLLVIETRCRDAARDKSHMLPADTLPPPVGAYVVVLVVSDAPQDAHHLRMRLAGMDITASNVVSVLQTLPAYLAGSAAHSWSAYVAFVR